MGTDRPEFLMAPGPTEVPPDVLQAQAREVPYHRGPRFGRILRECCEALQRILFTRSDVLLFTGSGSLGMESAVVNLLSPGERILVCNTGNFADRFEEIAKVHGIETKSVVYEWGANANAADVERELEADPTIKAVFCQHSETSTGIVNDVEAIGAVVKERPQLLVVDAISAVGAAPLRVDDWGIDAPSTRQAVEVLGKVSVEGRVLAVLTRDDEAVWKSLRNLPDVHVLTTDQLNAYDVLVSDWVVFTQASLPQSAPVAADEHDPATPVAVGVRTSAEGSASDEAQPAETGAQRRSEPTGDTA